MHSIQNRFVIGSENILFLQVCVCVCVCVCALFSPEILQAGAVKGLTSHQLTGQKLDHSSG